MISAVNSCVSTLVSDIVDYSLCNEEEKVEDLGYYIVAKLDEVRVGEKFHELPWVVVGARPGVDGK